MWGTEIEARIRATLLEHDPGYEQEISKGFFYRATPLFQNKLHQRESVVHLLQNNVPKDMPILDYGCGTGQYLLYLWHHGFRNLIGCDHNQRWLDASRYLLDRIGEPGAGTLKRVGRESIYDIASHLGYAQFGAIMMFGLINGHGIDIARVFHSVFAALRPGGWFFANDPVHPVDDVKALIRDAGLVLEQCIVVQGQGENIIYTARRPT